MTNVIKQIAGFYNNSFYYTDTGSLYLHKKFWSDLVDNGCVGKFLGLGKNDYGSSGVFYACFPSPKIKYCLVIDDFQLNARSKDFLKNIEK